MLEPVKHTTSLYASGGSISAEREAVTILYLVFQPDASHRNGGIWLPYSLPRFISQLIHTIMNFPSHKTVEKCKYPLECIN